MNNPGAYHQGTQPLTALSAAVSILLAVAGAIAVVGAAGLFNRVGVMSDYEADDATLADLDDADGLVLGTQIGFLIALVVPGALWIVWQHQASCSPGSSRTTRPS